MEDFDRELVQCIGTLLASGYKPDRKMIADCYLDTLRKLNSQEKEQVTEKWIDYLWGKIDGLRIDGKNSKQIARQIFKLIAKS